MWLRGGEKEDGRTVCLDLFIAVGLVLVFVAVVVVVFGPVVLGLMHGRDCGGGGGVGAAAGRACRHAYARLLTDMSFPSTWTCEEDFVERTVPVNWRN